jgi:ABC-type Mn2+/Zn2+ transport system permease subunit
LRDYLALFGLSLLASVIAAPVLALCGALLHLRREAFLGVAVPQFATAGVAAALWLLPSFPALHRSFLEHGHPPMLYLLPFAAGAACLTLLAYGMRASRAPAASQLAGGFALAGALAFVFLARAPSGANFAETVLRGEVLLLDQHDFQALAAVSAAGLAFLAAFRRTLLVGALDPEQAYALRLPLRAVNRSLPIVLGVGIGCGVMTLGPILVFALLFLPPLAAALLTRGLRGFLVVTVLLALLVVILAWPAAILADLPYGPTAGLLAGSFWLLAAATRRIRRS